MFDKILIANRGEIACRIIATCRRLGVSTVAVYSEADAGARHVRLADEAVCIGPAAATDSYLRVDRVIAAAQATGAQAIHPGYGFLSENDRFADACADAGITFIGPPADAIRAMGSKSAAKALMECAGVPLVPGYHGADQDPAHLRAEADRIGYPVLIKASAGGGGKGMRVVDDAGGFDAALASCQREARASFGDDRVLIEKYLQRPRHIEVQVFGDSHGSVVHLYERDCSAQRRHQKVVEEAPAPGVGQAFRDAIGKAAVDAAQAVGYVGAGTVEFIVDADGSFFFMEMNTRLQVEHPVTEMVTGQDLVEWQLRVAAGGRLPLRQEEVALDGHAIEVRVYAEQPEKEFLPASGRVEYLRLPEPGGAVRIDSGIDQGDAISPYYDPMIAKLIVHGESREQAIAQLARALHGFLIVGVGNNIRFLSRLVEHPRFREGGFDTGLIERELPALVGGEPGLPPDAAGIAALWMLASRHGRTAGPAAGPWDRADGWRINGALERSLEFTDAAGGAHVVHVRYGSGGTFRIDGVEAGMSGDGARRRFRLAGRQVSAEVVEDAEGRLHILTPAGSGVLAPVDRLAHAGEEADEHGGLIAPMPGRIIAIHVGQGDEVAKGAPLLVMEAMKMEYTITAPADGTVRALLCGVDDLVAEKAPLVDFEVKG